MSSVRIAMGLLADVAAFVCLLFRPQRSIAAENLFLRRQLAMYRERGVNPRRADTRTRVSLVLLSRLFDWRGPLTLVTPRTFIGWHRQAFRPLWRATSLPGRLPILRELRDLTRQIAKANPSWGQERIANELLLKLGLRVSPRTVRKYMSTRPHGRPRGDQRWATFLRNYADAIVACDFCVVVTVNFQLLYVFILIEHASRQVLHMNVTRNPTAQWTLQQSREAIAPDTNYRFLIHDRDSIFSTDLD